MHECPWCGCACDCDGEDTWLDTPDDCNHCPNGDIENDYSQMDDLFEIYEIMEEANRLIELYSNIVNPTFRTKWCGKHYGDTEVNRNSGGLRK